MRNLVSTSSSMQGADHGGSSPGQINPSSRFKRTRVGAPQLTSGLSMLRYWSTRDITRHQPWIWHPVPGGPVAAVEIIKGTGAPQLAPTVPVKFSGYDWDVRTIAADRGGLNHLYDGDNAWTDQSGALHIRMKKKG